MCNCKQQQFELLPELEAILKYEASPYSYEYETPPARSYIKGFSGPAAECTAALTLANKTQAAALAIINTQIAEAIKMLRVAADKLKQGKRTAATNRIFQKIFRVPPSFVPTWFKPSATIKDRGDVVGTRCSRVADLLASGWIRYFCSITGANCPDCATSDGSEFACSSWGRESTAPKNSNVICFGRAFWQAMKDGNTADILSTVMHEPFHIYYGIYVTEHPSPTGMGFPRASVGKFGGIDCIVRFVFEINGRTATPIDIDSCNRNFPRTAGTGF